MSEEVSEVSEWANELAQWSAQTKREVRSKQMIERCKGTIERMSEWPSRPIYVWILDISSPRRNTVKATLRRWNTQMSELVVLVLLLEARDHYLKRHLTVISRDLGSNGFSVLIQWSSKQFMMIPPFTRMMSLNHATARYLQHSSLTVSLIAIAPYSISMQDLGLNTTTKIRYHCPFLQYVNEAGTKSAVSKMNHCERKKST